MGKRSNEFAQIIRGDAVEVEGPHGLHLSGVVEDIAPDGSVLWIREENGHSRRMVHVTDGAEVRRRKDSASAASGEAGFLEAFSFTD